MDDGTKTIIVGIVFLIFAGISVYISNGITLLNGALIVISVLDIFTGIMRKYKK